MHPALERLEERRGVKLGTQALEPGGRLPAAACGHEAADRICRTVNWAIGLVGEAP